MGARNALFSLGIVLFARISAGRYLQSLSRVGQEVFWGYAQTDVKSDWLLIARFSAASGASIFPFHIPFTSFKIARLLRIVRLISQFVSQNG